MVKGLREQILETAKRTGFHDAEVMTTDTHMVNGIVHAPLGYRVVGEVIPWSSLLTDIAIACQEAIDSLKPSQVGVISGKVAVTTLGSKSLRQVMQVVYRISKLTSLTLFPMVAILTVISLLLLV
jgi:predicted neutral ceramidase superfamily lipid hydrolase